MSDFFDRRLATIALRDDVVESRRMVTFAQVSRRVRNVTVARFGFAVTMRCRGRFWSSRGSLPLMGRIGESSVCSGNTRPNAWLRVSGGRDRCAPSCMTFFALIDDLSIPE